jgi:hypothetical protein
MATIDERLEALTTHLELLHHDVETLAGTMKEQGRTVERIFRRISRFETAVLRIGAIHSERIDRLEREIFGDLKEEGGDPR